MAILMKKIELEKGTGECGIGYETRKVKIGRDKMLVDKDGNLILDAEGKVQVRKKAAVLNQKVSTVTVKLPTGEELTGEASCHAKDQFSYKTGRRAALKALFESDTRQARQQAEGLAMAGKLSAIEQISMDRVAQKFYKISRQDRKRLFKTVCPDLFRNDPERVKQRALALRDRLLKKYPIKPE